ncbi:MAG: lipoyl synthase [Actinobacteria bacterium]|nr:lipoyl synthase [Actinomycetota bacterium]
MTLRARWLGRVGYHDAHVLQRALFERTDEQYLLLMEHPHVYTMGVRAKPEHLLAVPASVGADVVRSDRGGDVTYHGPGQLVGYPVVSVPVSPGASPRHVHAVEQVVIDVLSELGLPGAGRLDGYPGVWIEDRKICAVGVRLSRGRSMHGFALNVAPDLEMFDHIVPCGIRDKRVTSMAAEGVKAEMRDVVEGVVRRAALQWGSGQVERAEVAWSSRPQDLAPFSRAHGAGAGGQPVRLLGRLSAAGVDSASSLPLGERKPEWLRVKADMGPQYRQLKQTMRSLDLATVCEEAGCPNIFECWNDGTATFMINGARCSRACGFCLVDTRRPQPLDPGEPERVAAAVARMGLAHAVVTAVARDDLPDGGAAAFAATIAAIRRRSPTTAVEVLVPDCKGDAAALGLLYGARPDVFNHNLETVARLQRAVRPSASYARSLAVLAAAKAGGLKVKSGLIVGMGETDQEVVAALHDLRAVGVDIVTVGQYLRPTGDHLPVSRWWSPEEFDSLRRRARAMGFAHVECSPLTRSSYHARQAAEAAPAG